LQEEDVRGIVAPAVGEIVLDHVTKAFGSDVFAVNDVRSGS
jgi:hypothetical protein